MKKLLKALVIAAAALMFSVNAFADEAVTSAEPEKKQLSVVCIGNSILRHAPSAGIGWNNDWGMAASAKEKDYFHLLQQYAKEDGFNVYFEGVGAGALETMISNNLNYDYKYDFNHTVKETILAVQPDVIILQIGENGGNLPRDLAGFEHALEMITKHAEEIAPGVKFIYCMPFWGGIGQEAAFNTANKLHMSYADLTSLTTKENMAVGLFEHSGVASHPGDKGMEAIAKEMYGQLKVLLAKAERTDLDIADVWYDGKYIEFDVPPQLINSRTMIPARFVFETLGAKVGWIEESETVTIDKGSVKMSIKLGDMFFTINGKQVEIDTPAQLVGDRTLIPARALVEALGYKVEWSDEERTVYIIDDPEAQDKIQAENAGTVDETARTKVELTAESFVAGPGFALVSADRKESANDATSVTKVDDGIKVVHGGYYTDGNKWSGVALKDAYKLDGLSVTIKYDKVPVVAKNHDCWAHIGFMNKPELFKVGNVVGNKGFMNLIRFSNSKWEIYGGIKEFNQTEESVSDNEIFNIKSGDVVTVSAKLVGDIYEFTFKNGDKSVAIKRNSKDFTNVFAEGKAHVVISASSLASAKDDFEYTITDISYLK